MEKLNQDEVFVIISGDDTQIRNIYTNKDIAESDCIIHNQRQYEFYRNNYKSLTEEKLQEKLNFLGKYKVVSLYDAIEHIKSNAIFNHEDKYDDIDY